MSGREAKKAQQKRRKQLFDVALHLVTSFNDVDYQLGDKSDIHILENTDGSIVVKYDSQSGLPRELSIDQAIVDDCVANPAKLKSRHTQRQEARSSDQEACSAQPGQLIMPPGATLLEWSRLIFPKKFVEGEITNTIHDMQHEYIESIGEDRKWHPKWVCVRGYMSYGVCVFCGLVGGVGKRIVDAWKGVNPS